MSCCWSNFGDRRNTAAVLVSHSAIALHGHGFESAGLFLCLVLPSFFGSSATFMQICAPVLLTSLYPPARLRRSPRKCILTVEHRHCVRLDSARSGTGFGNVKPQQRKSKAGNGHWICPEIVASLLPPNIMYSVRSQKGTRFSEYLHYLHVIEQPGQRFVSARWGLAKSKQNLPTTSAYPPANCEAVGRQACSFLLRKRSLDTQTQKKMLVRYRTCLLRPSSRKSAPRGSNGWAPELGPSRLKETSTNAARNGYDTRRHSFELLSPPRLFTV